MTGAVSPIDSMYFNAAFNSPNIAFMGAQQNAQAQLQAYKQMLQKYEAAADATRVDNTSAVASNMAFKGKAKEESSNTGLYVAGALAAATYAGYCIYTKQNPWQAAKTLFGKAKNIFTGKGGSEGVTKEMKAVIKDGKLSFMVPGKTKVETDPDKIRQLAKDFNIDLNTLLKTTKGNIKSLDGGKFIMDGNLVTFKGNKIVEILNGANENITDKILKATTGDDKIFASKLQEFVTNARSLNKGWGKGLLETNITTQIGDEVLNMTRTGKQIAQRVTKDGNEIWEVARTGTPSVTMNKFTTLDWLKPDDPAVLNWLRDHGKAERIFGSKEFLEKAKYLSGTNPDTVLLKSKVGDGTERTYKYVNGKLTGFFEGETFHPERSEHFGAFFQSNKEDIGKIYKSQMESSIPSDAMAILSLA